MRAPKRSGRNTRARVRAGVRAGLPAGVIATLAMDAAMVLASRFAGDAFASEKIGPEIIGRWAGRVARCRRCGPTGNPSVDISAEPPLRGELCIGMAVHYLTGIALTEVYVVFLCGSGRKPGPAVTTAVATTYGLATAVLPLLFMFPSMGYGCCARASGDAARLRRIMLLGHAAFGAGIGLATLLPPARAAVRAT